MVAQGAHPCNAQLSERNAFTIRYCRQSFHELERGCVSMVSGPGTEWAKALTSRLLESPPRFVSNPRPSGLLGSARYNARDK